MLAFASSLQEVPSMNRLWLPALLMLALGSVLPSTRAMAQTAAPSGTQDETTVNGTIVSSTSSTLVLRTDEGLYLLFVLDRDTARPKVVPIHARATVASRPEESGEARHATTITITAPPPPTPPTPQGVQPGTQADVIPPGVRQMERQVTRQVRRYRVGVVGGATLDPELISIAGHAKLGPFFDQDVSFRPGLEYAFGEVTKLVAVNLEATYRLPLTPRRGRWSMYVGAGPGLAFRHLNFEGSGEEPVDFGEFDFDLGFNFLVGVELRNGFFLEWKSTAYNDPHVRMLVGFNF
jgi:hypothetical protein